LSTAKTKQSFGIRLKSVRLQKVVLFEDASFKFANGITYVVGKNTNRREPDASNMTGKSLLFSILPQAILDASPLPVKGIRSASKDGMSKSSCITVSAEVGDQKVDVSKSLAKHTILIEGSDIQRRGKVLVKDKLKTLFPLSEEEFFSLYYLNTLRPNTLQYGTAPVRAQFFVNLFRLNHLDEVRKWLLRQSSEVAENQRLRDRLREELKALPQHKPLADLRSTIELLSSRQERLKKEARDLNIEWTQSQLHESVQPARRRVKELRAQLKEDGASLREEYRKLEKKRRTLIDLKRQQELYQESQAKLKGNPYVGKDKDELKLLRTKIIQRQNQLQSTASDEPDKPAVSRKLATLGESVSESIATKATRQVALYMQAKNELADFKELLREHQQCPTCRSELSGRVTRATVKMLRNKALKLRREAAALLKQKKARVAWIEWSEYAQAVEEFKRQEKIRHWLKKHSLKQINAVVESSHIKPITHKGDVRTELQVLARRLNTVTEQLRLADQLAEAQALYDDLKKRVVRPTREQSVIRKDLDRVAERMDRIGEELPKATADYRLAKETHKQRRKLQATISELRSGSRAKVLQALVNVFSKGGVKLLVLQRIARLLQQNMNKYAKLLYPEPMEFTLTVTHSRFDITATRMLKARKDVSDVRNLSGAESRLFPLLLLLALLPMIPIKRRMDTLILDEPETNMDPGMRRILTDTLLPQLNKIVPKIVVISPHQSLVPAGARAFTVVKRGDQSTLERGLQ